VESAKMIECLAVFVEVVVAEVGNFVNSQEILLEEMVEELQTVLEEAVELRLLVVQVKIPLGLKQVVEPLKMVVEDSVVGPKVVGQVDLVLL